ncbi:MAG: YCF48-related protein [Ignavibacteria bacterium]
MIDFFRIVFLVFIFTAVSKSQWIIQNSGTNQILNSVHFVNAQTGYTAGNSGILLKTSNGGINWVPLNSGTSEVLNSVHFFNSTSGIVCGNSGIIIRTTNGGANWNNVNSGVSAALNSISFSDNVNGICSGHNGTLLWSSNGGVSWVIGQQGFLVSYYGVHMVNSLTGYAAGVNTIFAPLIAKTSNGGMNWTYSTFYVNNNEATLRDIHFININEGFTVSNVWDGQGGISYTSNGGLNWTHQLFTNALNSADFPSANTGYAVGFSGSILKTTNRGISWTAQSSPVSNILRGVSFADSLTGFAVGDNGVTLKTSNGGITYINRISSGVPDKFYLYQNYPNPFNPITKIKFDLPASPFSLGEGMGVRLVIYDVLGREVVTLIDEQLRPGTYEVDFDGSNYPSGVYFYTLSAGDYSETKKMILLK